MWASQLRCFAQTTKRDATFIALDLDGTAILEDQGKVFISSAVEKGVKAMHDRAVPIVLNTLRFPLSVMRTIGKEWYDIADVPILTVLLNGSLLGEIKRTNGELHYEELATFTLQRHEIESMLAGIKQLCVAGIDDVLFFYYPRDWRRGEILWTSQPQKVAPLRSKYVSASRVISCDLTELAKELHAEPICMASLFIDRPEDHLMAYQHSKRNTFFTTKGVDKAFGLRAIAGHIQRDPSHALGAGDTPIDTFLSEVGCAIIVGGAQLPFRGKSQTIALQTPVELGHLIQAYGELLK